MNEGVMKNSCSKGSPGAVEKQRKRLNQRQKARILLIFSVAFLAVTAILGVVLHDAAMVTDPDFLCYGKRAEGSDCRCGADALDISGKADSRRGYAASGK